MGVVVDDVVEVVVVEVVFVEVVFVEVVFVTGLLINNNFLYVVTSFRLVNKPNR